MPNTEEGVTIEGEGERYVEDPDFVPNPVDQFGTFDTSATAGAAHARIQEISPIFEVAKAQDLATAKRALDPNDDSVDSSLVVLSTGTTVVQGDPEADKNRVIEAAEAAASEPVDVLGKRPGEEEAAEEGDDAAAKAQAQQQQSGAGSGGNVKTDVARQLGGNEPSKAEAEKKDAAKKS